MWNDNLDELIEGKDDQYQLPAIFIEFDDDIQWMQIGNGCQEADINIKLHIVYDFYDAMDGTKGQNLLALQLAQDVYKTIQDWMPSTVTINSGGEYAMWAGTYNVPIGVMVRTGDAQDKSHNNVYHFIQTYTTSIIDSDMDRPVNGTLSTPPLDFELDLIAPWDNTALYVVDNYVSYNNSVDVYKCIQNTTSSHEPPTNTNYWILIPR
jgi:hypothetical protein